MTSPDRGGRLRRGPELPYKLLAGVVPYPGGWLVARGRLVGITLYPDDPHGTPKLRDVVDNIPEYTVIALAAPIGLEESPHRGGRDADHEARRLLGFPRAGAIASTPCKPALAASSYPEAQAANGGVLDVITWRQFRHIAEVAAEVQPYMQRRIYEVRPELSLFQLNDDQPMRLRKRSVAGVAERSALLLNKMPGAERVLNAELPRVRAAHLVDACAALWTARRISARAVARVPETPQWNDDGLRMEIVR
jgi:predicted RNase H-like nuclease